MFHNVPGKLMQIEDLKAQLKRNLSNSTAKARIEGLIRWVVLVGPIMDHLEVNCFLQGVFFNQQPPKVSDC